MENFVLVTLSDMNFLDQAKQLFSSAYLNGGWRGDYCLLSHNLSEDAVKMFKDRGIIVYECKIDFQKKTWKQLYPETVLSKFYLFMDFFKKWRNVLFLDSDMIVRSDLNKLSSVKGFNSCNINKERLGLYFSEGRNKELLKKFYNLKKLAFNSGIMAFRTDIIKPDSFDDLKNLFNTYCDICTGDAVWH